MTDKLMQKLARMYDDIYTERPYKHTKTVSFLIYHNKIVSFGINSDKTSPIQNKYRMLTHKKDIRNFWDKEHSEVSCLKKADNSISFNRCELVTISKRRNGDFRLARPCVVCMEAIKDYGVHDLYYSNQNGTFTYERV